MLTISRPGSRELALRGLLGLTMVSGYMNALLRTSPESQVTLFRILLPFALFALVIRQPTEASTRWTFRWVGMLIVYSVAQIFAFRLSGDVLIWSYLVNLAAAILFVYVAYSYRALFGWHVLEGHLFFWYRVLVVLSFHQMATGFVYPNVTLFVPDYLPIWYGQPNDASLALAAFMPLLLARCRYAISGFVWLALGLYILYLNNTRGVLLGVVAYFVILGVTPLARAIRRIGFPTAFGLAVVVVTVVASVMIAKDVQIELSDETNTLDGMLVEPIRNALSGRLMTAELTSINVRVTTTVIGVARYVSTYGFGVGPGASVRFVVEQYEGIARSMHVFPLQLLVESGWMFVALITWVVVVARRRLDGGVVGRSLMFCVLVSLSMTSGAITNYFFFGCAVAMLSAVRAGHDDVAVPA